MSLVAGTKLGPYEIVSPIGAGGMGEVYRAKDTNLNRDVALKILPESFALDADRVARFKREAQVLASLNHPNIAAIYGIESNALVMELVEGEDLSAHIARGAIPLADALPIAKQIADALEAAHELGIVHRDLKPANIKVRADGTVKVLDFGLAKALDSARARAMDPAGASNADAMNSPTMTSPAMTEMGMILGTAAYMSPEQAAGKAVDKRSDLWSFGVVVYEMLTGQRLFTGETVSHVMAAVLTKDPDWAALPVEAPTAIRRLLRRCLEKDRRRRIADAADIRLELDEAGSRDTPDAGFAAMPEVAGVPAWRRSLPWTVAGILALGLVSTLVLWSPWRAAPDARVLKLSIVQPEGTSFHTMAISPDGRMLAFTATDASGQISLWLRPLDSLIARVLPSTEGAAFPFWSPDSRHVGYSAPGGIRKIAVSGGPSQKICSQDGSRGATWSRSGVILFTAGTSSPLWQVSADGGDAVPVTSLDASRGELSHRWPSFLPDGRHYVFTIRGGQRDVPGIYVGSLDSSLRTRLTGDLSNATYAESATGAGYLLFARGHTLLAQPFDVGQLRLADDPVVIDANVHYSATWALAPFSTSQTGVLVVDSAGRGRDIQLVWFDRTGARRGVVGEFVAGKLSLSPDATRLALDSLDPQTLTPNLWIVDLRRDITTRFTPGAERAQQTPVWSPDGSRIAFVSENVIYERSANGTGEDSLLLKGDSPMAIQDWSRDGSFLLYRKAVTQTKGELWVLPMSPGADRTPFQVVRSQFDQASGAFSPDGKWIAFDSGEDPGTGEVFVQAFSRSGSSGRWQVSKSGGLHPQWRGDGKELFFLASDMSKLMSVSVAPGPSFDAGPPTAVFAGSFDTGINPRFTVTPDGQRFLISVLASATSSAPPTVILNWTAALRK